VAVQLVRSQWVQYLRRLGAGDIIELSPEVAQRIQNFRRVKMEGDRMTWEVAAREAQYFEEQDAIVVQEPQVSFHLEDGDGVVSLSGATGRIVLHGHEMDRAELDGGIEVRFKDYLVRADRAVYDRALGTVVAPSAVSVTSDGLVLTGDRMIVEMDTQRVRLEGAVETILRRPEQEDGADAGQL
jgi:LPS export ABC transporter protein LptC